MIVYRALKLLNKSLFFKGKIIFFQSFLIFCYPIKCFFLLPKKIKEHNLFHQKMEFLSNKLYILYTWYIFYSWFICPIYIPRIKFIWYITVRYELPKASLPVSYSKVSTFRINRPKFFLFLNTFYILILKLETLLYQNRFI